MYALYTLLNIDRHTDWVVKTGVIVVYAHNNTRSSLKDIFNHPI